MSRERRYRLPLSLRLSLFVRSLSLQGSWNNQRMQNLGLLFTLLPWLRRRPRDTNRNRMFFRRYYVFFNTNPYLANFLIGGLIRLEEDHETDGQPPLETIATYRDSLGRAFASLGDQLFWLGLRPALVMAICLVGLAGYPRVVMALIGVFALAQLVLRWITLQRGYGSGMDILGFLGSWRWHAAIRAAKRTGMVLTGMITGYYLSRIWDFSGPFGQEAVWIGVGVGIGLPLVLRRRLPGEIMLLLALALAMTVAFAISGLGG